MKGAWRNVASADNWESMCHFIDTYFKDAKGISWRETQLLPIPKEYEVSFKDQYGDIFVVYELPGYMVDKFAYLDYPDIDEDYNEDVRDYLRNKYYYDDQDEIDYYGRSEYDDDYQSEVRSFLLALERSDLLMRRYFPFGLPSPRLVSADRGNSWYLGALNGV